MKTFIQNRKGQKIAVIVEQVPNQKGLVFVMHGLGGFKDQPHIQVFAEAWKEQGYTVVRFDTTNTFGESDGKYEDATVTNYFEDLEDVISWASRESWYEEPFSLCGHSLGGTCTALYAQQHPEKVKSLAPISTMVSGQLSVKELGPVELAHWKKTGWREKPSTSLPGVMKRLKWSHIADRLKYDLLPLAGKLTMPIFLLTGDQDDSTPSTHQQILFDLIPGPKEIHVIKGGPHTFRSPEHLTEIKALLKNWIQKG